MASLTGRFLKVDAGFKVATKVREVALGSSSKGAAVVHTLMTEYKQAIGQNAGAAKAESILYGLLLRAILAAFDGCVGMGLASGDNDIKLGLYHCVELHANLIHQGHRVGQACKTALYAVFLLWDEELWVTHVQFMTKSAHIDDVASHLERSKKLYVRRYIPTPDVLAARYNAWFQRFCM
eukprot:360335-Chlamydomonas_euryale.AAC.4